MSAGPYHAARRLRTSRNSHRRPIHPLAHAIRASIVNRLTIAILVTVTCAVVVAATIRLAPSVQVPVNRIVPGVVPRSELSPDSRMLPEHMRERTGDNPGHGR